MGKRSIIRSGDMSYRAEAIAAIEGGVVALGLQPIVAAYLSSVFGAGELAELSDVQLAQALRFVAEVQKAAPLSRPSAAPLPRTADGEYLWFRGRFDWSGR